MASIPIVSQLPSPQQSVRSRWRPFVPWRRCPQRPSWQQLVQEPQALPRFVRESIIAGHYLRLLAPLDWDNFPERNLEIVHGFPPVPFAPFVGACLVKLDRQLPYMSHLWQYLVQHPALTWLLGFPPAPSARNSWGFDVTASLPCARHFTRMLRRLPNDALQWLLDDTVRLIQAELDGEMDDLGQIVSLDTKHILAWVKENNPKAYIHGGRYDKTKQPSGDPDCRLGCKRRTNQRKNQADVESLPTPTTNPVPAKDVRVGEFYWGYGSGIVATKIANWAEIVLAELTQPFDQPDVSYFHPLLADVERRLGHRPSFGALDAAYDAFYVYEYFDDAGGFAAVPLTGRGGGRHRTFSDKGLPLCEAGMPMPLKHTYECRTTLITHERGRYACPLRYPEPTGEECPIQHKNWAKKGCVTTLATSKGARLRYQIDRDSELYRKVYKQRTATERIYSQAADLGMERPKLRNGQAIANQNTLIYILINLRALHRIRERKSRRGSAS